MVCSFFLFPQGVEVMRLRSIGVLLLGLILASFNAANAQERFGGLEGVVKDSSAAPVPGATVTATNKTTATARTVVSGPDGSYKILGLDPGRYSVVVELSGFQKAEDTNVMILLGRNVDFSPTLQVGAVTEVVNVTGTTPQIDPKSTTVSHNVAAEEFNLLPKARSFQQMAMTAPSVNTGLIEGGIQVNGASGAENIYTVDGVITNSLINGSSRQNTVFEYLQEVQVKTTGISAEYGGALGGVISAVTKSGGNTLHGEGHYYFDGSPLSSAPVKRLILSPVDQVTVGYYQDDKQPNYRNEPGASVGGPIVKDRLFYFGSYSPRFIRSTNNYLFSNGTEPGSIKSTQTATQAFGKLSYSGGPINAYGSVLLTPTTQTGTLPAFNGAGTNWVSSTKAGNASRITQGLDQQQRNATGNVDISVTSNSILTVRGGYFYDNYKDTGIPLTTSWQYQSPCCARGEPANLAGAIGAQNVAPVTLNEFDTTKRGFFAGVYTITFHGAGLHELRGGGGVDHTVNDVRKAYPGGRVQVFWDQAASLPNGSTPQGKYGYYTVDDLGTIGTAGANLTQVFAQDRWQVNDRLTLNLGLRTEDEKLPTFRPDLLKYAFHFTMKDKLAPRLGAAYDLRADGRMKVFGAWGRYFDFTKYELARGSFGGDTWKTYYRAIDDANITAFQSAHLDSSGACQCPGTDIWQVPGSFRDQRVPDFSGLDPNIKPMSQDSLNGGFEFQLSPRSVIGIHAVRNKLNRTIEDIGTLVDGNEVYIYGNPGEGRAIPADISGATPSFNIPKPKRVYDAIDVTWDRRLAQNWFFSANYTYSRLFGNYAGIANSDEIRTPTTGSSYAVDQQNAGNVARAGGNESRAYDLDELMFDSHGNLGVYGLLPTDRPHVAKFSGAYTTGFGTQFGLVQYAGSGTPLSTIVDTANRTDPVVNGRGDMGRTPTLLRTDFLVAHELHMGTRSLRAELNLLNIFNQKTATHEYTWLNRGFTRSGSRINLSKVNLLNGYDYNALLKATPDAATALTAYDPRYGMQDLFATGLTGQFTIKFLF
jgi:carboxypeptidase family protein